VGSQSTLLDLGDRYWALGLPAAARSALVRALAQTDDVTPALRLTDVALAQGDVQAARKYAAEAAKRAPGPATKILLGRAQLAAGELAAARMSLLAALDSPKLTAWDRVRAHLELARAADAHGDAPGVAAQAAAAFETMLGAASALPPDVNLIEEVAATVVAHGRAADAQAIVDAARDRAGAGICAAALLSARQAAGDSTVTDRAIDDELAALGDGAAIRLRRLERRTRKPASGDRAALLAELVSLIEAAVGEDLAAIDRARLQFLYGSLCAEDPALRGQAEDAYRKGLAFQPGHTAAACRLALLMLDRGDQAGALAEIERALRIDASHGLAWRNAARMLDAQSPSLGVVVGRLLDAANPGAGSAAGGVAPRLVTATAEVTRHDTLAGVYAHGHRVKNLLGIIGARARSARKLLVEQGTRPAAGNGEMLERLRDLETDVTSLYEEWAQYLRSMQAPTPTVELVPLSPLLNEVVIAAQARTQHVPIALETAAGLPDVRGDRMLLREALLNVVSNAAEACAADPGEVHVRVRAIVAPGGSTAPLVELVISDAERVVAAHHGRITVDSEEGRGTTITITLPTDKTGLSQLPLWTTAERGLP
jgi:signal transduction histidine kinase